MSIRNTATRYEIEVTRHGDDYAVADLGAVDCVAAVATRADFRARFTKAAGFKVELFMSDDDGRRRVIDAFDAASFRARLIANASAKRAA